MITKEQIEQLAEQYAKEQNSCYTNDYYGFIAGFEMALSKLHQPTVSVSVFDCRHIFLQHDSQWQKCTKCGMIAPLQTGR